MTLAKGKQPYQCCQFWPVWKTLQNKQTSSLSVLSAFCFSSGSCARDVWCNPSKKQKSERQSGRRTVQLGRWWCVEQGRRSDRALWRAVLRELSRGDFASWVGRRKVVSKQYSSNVGVCRECQWISSAASNKATSKKNPFTSEPTLPDIYQVRNLQLRFGRRICGTASRNRGYLVEPFLWSGVSV